MIEIVDTKPTFIMMNTRIDLLQKTISRASFKYLCFLFPLSASNIANHSSFLLIKHNVLNIPSISDHISIGIRTYMRLPPKNRVKSPMMIESCKLSSPSDITKIHWHVIAHCTNKTINWYTFSTLFSSLSRAACDKSKRQL